MEDKAGKSFEKKPFMQGKGRCLDFRQNGMMKTTGSKRKIISCEVREAWI